MRILKNLSLLILVSIYFQSCKNDKIEELQELEDCSVTITMTENSCSKFSFSNSELISMDWEVDGNLVSKSTTFDFQPEAAGTFEICGIYESPTCPRGEQVCESVSISRDCFTEPDCSISLRQIKTSCSSYTLANNLEVEMDWTINGEDVVGDKTLAFAAETAGTYEICGSYVTEECSNGMLACTTIEVGESCFVTQNCEVSLTQTENSCSSYVIANTEQVVMEWYIDGVPITTNKEYQFVAQAAGTYEICGFYESQECTQGVQVCTSLEIEQVCLTPEICEAKVILAQNTCSNYVLFSDQEQLMDWSVNNIPMVQSVTFNFDATAPGIYEICCHGESTDCPDGIRACKTLQIEESCFANDVCDVEILMEEVSCSEYNISNNIDADIPWTVNGFQIASGVGFNFSIMMPGSYELCGLFDPADCSEEVCTTLEISEDCF